MNLSLSSSWYGSLFWRETNNNVKQIINFCFNVKQVNHSDPFNNCSLDSNADGQCIQMRIIFVWVELCSCGDRRPSASWSLPRKMLFILLLFVHSNYFPIVCVFPYSLMRGNERWRQSPYLLCMLASILGFPFDICIFVVFFLGDYEGATHKDYMNCITEWWRGWELWKSVT